jgi:signal peptidase I
VRRRTKVLLGLALASLTVGLTIKFVVAPYLVVGESMTPTLQSWDLCLMQRVHHYRPQRGDIVAFRTSDDPPLHFIKRVVALPGETLAVRAGAVEINGVRLTSQYAVLNPDWEIPPTIVPIDKVYVIGDNRQVGVSETLHGLVATRLIEARLVAHWRWKR